MEANKPLQRRWYDKDPVLSQAMSTLEHSDDDTQIRIALNLIKIIIEHNIENDKFESVEDIMSAVQSGQSDSRNGRWHIKNSYDNVTKLSRSYSKRYR